MTDFTEGVRISKERLNGLRLRAAEDGTKYDNLTLDLVLQKAGVLELTDKQLEKELRKLQRVEVSA